MSSMGINVPEPSEVNYHEAEQVQRVERALKRLDPGDVLAVIDSRIAAEGDPAKHPLYQLVCWHLERQLTPLDGAESSTASTSSLGVAACEQ